MDLDEARAFVGTNHRAILATTRRDGGVQMSPVAVGIDNDGAAIVSTRETAIKTKNIRRTPTVAVCVMVDGFYGQFVQIEGNATVVELPEAMDGLIEYYRSVSGEHPDWDEYRAAMISEQRVLLRIDISRAGPDVSG